MAATQCIQARRHGQDNLTNFNPETERKKGDLSGFEAVFVVGAKGVVSVFQNLPT